MTCLTSFAQKDGWQVYPAFTYPVQCLQADGRLYVITSEGATDNNAWHRTPSGRAIYFQTLSGNLLSYDLSEKSIHTFDCLGELNDQHISVYSYNESARRLVLVYDDGNIDILDPEDNSVINIASLMEKDVTVNSIFCNAATTYLCTSAGIIELDAENAVIRNTYTFDSPVSAMCLCNGYFYIATDAALLRVDCDDNMNDRQARQTIIPYRAYDVASLDGMVYTLCNNSDGREVLQNIDTSTPEPTVTATGWTFTRMRHSSDFVFFDSDSWYAYYKKGSSRLYYTQLSHNWYDVCPVSSSCIWIVDGDNCLKKYSVDSESNQFVLADAVDIDINSPKRDAAYCMSYDALGRLLVAGGVPPYSVYSIPETAMLQLSDGTWVNFDEESQKTLYPYLDHHSLVSLVEDPEDPTHFYAAVSRNGLEEYKMNSEGKPEFQKLYNADNSPLRIIKENEGMEDTEKRANFCGCYGLTYDHNGNLWMAQEAVDTIVRILRSDGQWISLYYPDIQLADHPRTFLFPKSGPCFLINEKDSHHGIFGIDTNGTLNYVDDDRCLLRSTITNQRNTSYSPKNFYCMTETQDGEIWCGTSSGLFVIADPSQWFDDGNFCFYQIIKNRDDGSGLADYVLDGVAVTAIAVDGANRKWIGTKGSGLYLLSDNGQDVLHHFTTDDSPILSDNIQCIAIEPSTGKVMIGTDVGICSYAEGVADAAETLDEDNVVIYPNPVTPDNSSLVYITNLTDKAEVKILSSSGQVVWGGQSAGGLVTWDCTDMRGHHVDSGVYHVLINTSDAGKTIVKRLVVVR